MECMHVCKCESFKTRLKGECDFLSLFSFVQRAFLLFLFFNIFFLFLLSYIVPAAGGVWVDGFVADVDERMKWMVNFLHYFINNSSLISKCATKWKTISISRSTIFFSFFNLLPNSSSIFRTFCCYSRLCFPFSSFFLLISFIRVVVDVTVIVNNGELAQAAVVYDGGEDPSLLDVFFSHWMSRCVCL